MTDPIKIPVTNSGKWLSISQYEIKNVFTDKNLNTLISMVISLEAKNDEHGNKIAAAVYVDAKTLSVGYGFNLKQKGAEDKYNEAVAACGVKCPSYESLQVGKSIPQKLSDQLLKNIVIEKQGNVNSYIKNHSGGVVANIPNDVYLALFMICYQDNKLFYDPSFKQAIKTISDYKDSPSARKALAHKYLDQIYERPDAYKTISRGIMAANFFGLDDYQVPPERLANLITQALNANPNKTEIEINGNYTDAELKGISSNLGNCRRFTLTMANGITKKYNGKTFAALEIDLEDIKGLCDVQLADDVYRVALNGMGSQPNLPVI